MPIKISHLKNDEREVTVTYGGEEAVVVYRPSGYTPVTENAMQDAMGDRRPGAGLARLLSGILVSWDVLDEDGDQMDTTYETISKLPVPFISAVVSQVSDDMNSDREEIKNSGGGSRGKRRGRALTGTP